MAAAPASAQDGVEQPPVPAATPTPTPAPEPTPTPEPERAFPLSGQGVTRWAHVERRVRVRAAPQAGARTVARLSTRTAERTDELVVALERRQVEGDLWVRVRLPVLPNGITGWVPRRALGAYQVVRERLVIDRARRTLVFRRGKRVLFRARIGVGEARWPTPRGEFYVRSRLSGFRDPVYGPLAFGTSARSAVLTDWPGGGFIGIHGTNEPGRIPGAISHGCIRLRNPDILRLGRRLKVGTPITIR